MNVFFVCNVRCLVKGLAGEDFGRFSVEAGVEIVLTEACPFNSPESVEER